jgi:hypothetical protein
MGYDRADTTILIIEDNAGQKYMIYMDDDYSPSATKSNYDITYVHNYTDHAQDIWSDISALATGKADIHDFNSAYNILSDFSKDRENWSEKMVNKIIDGVMWDDKVDYYRLMAVVKF